MRQRLLLGLVPALAALVLAAPTAPAATAAPAPAATAAPAPAATTATPQYDHVVLVLMENHARAAITSAAAPFLSAFGAQDTAYQAVAHPSLPNYIALTSGATQGCTSDRCPPQSLAVANVFAQMGADARSLAEAMPSSCHLADARPYVAHHNPEVYYANAPCSSQDVPLGATPDISAKLTFVTPDLDHDMHDGSVGAGDSWFRGFMAQVEATPQWQDERTAVVVTFDEGTGADQNVYLAVDSNQGLPGEIATPASHPDLLATIETVLGYPVIGPGDPSLLLPLFPGAASGGLVSALSVSPDPATTQAAIGFSLAQPAPVRITVTDAQGAVVRTLTDWGADWNAGADTATWGLRDDAGQRLAAGSYTVTVSARAADGSVGEAQASVHVASG